MSNRLCRLTALLLCLVLCLSTVTPVMAATHTTQASKIDGFTYSLAYGEKLNQIFQGNATMFSNSADRYALGQNIKMNKQYAVANVISGQQCYIYAQAVYHYLFGDVPYHGTGIGNYWKNSTRVLYNITSISYNTFINAGVGFGAYIRTTVNSNGSFSGSYGHSMILLGYDTSGLTYLDCNGDGKGMIRVTTRTWSEFNSVLLSSKGRRIAHVVQPNGVPAGPSTENPSRVDLGTNFTAMLLHGASGKPLAHSYTEGERPQVRIADRTGYANQFWYFSRQSDGSYKISSCHDGKYLDIRGASTESNALIQTSSHTGSDAQKWYIYELNGKYVLQSKLSGHVIGLNNNDAASGNYIHTTKWNKTSAQLWSIYRGSECTLKEAVLSVDAGDSLSDTLFTWNSISGAKEYELTIRKDGAAGEVYVTRTTTVPSCTLSLPVGTYQARVVTRHHYAEKAGTPVTFTVAAHSHDYVSTVTDPSCTDQGYTTYTCLTCGHTSHDDYTDALGHHFSYTLTKAPTFLSAGVLTGECSRGSATTDVILPMLNTADYDYAVVREPSSTENGIGRYTWNDTSYGTYQFEVTLDKLPPEEDGSPALPRFLVESKTVTAGQDVVLSVTAEDLPRISSLMIAFLSYDQDILEFVGAELQIDGVTAHWTDCITFPEDTDINGVIMTLTFRVRDDAAPGLTAVVSCGITAMAVDAEREIPVETQVIEGNITVAAMAPGDVNGDGRVNSLDLILLRQYLAGWDVTCDLIAADLNGSGTVNAQDLLLLRQHLTR